MKLYTEKEIRKAILIGSIHLKSKTMDELVESLTPIEIPSDDEIARVGLDFAVGTNVEYWNGFKHCADWMKEQILNQNK